MRGERLLDIKLVYHIRAVHSAVPLLVKATGSAQSCLASKSCTRQAYQTQLSGTKHSLLFRCHIFDGLCNCRCGAVCKVAFHSVCPTLRVCIRHEVLLEFYCWHVGMHQEKTYIATTQSRFCTDHFNSMIAVEQVVEHDQVQHLLPVVHIVQAYNIIMSF